MPTPFAVEALLLNKHVALSQQNAESSPSLDILSGLMLQVRAGEKLAIVGSSGSGKSTLLSLLAGLDTPSSGQVLIQGQDISRMDEDGRASIRARYMGFVFQSFQLMPTLTALENVMLPLQLLRNKDALDIASRALAKVGLAQRMQHYPKQLSGGEQQRVAIARAFAPQPSILFADEPTGNLDANTAKQIVDLLFSLNQEAGTTLILVTHDVGLAARCQRVLRLQNGQLQDEAV
jgi:putative ABC transport system ATP-binding protein